MYYLAQQYLRYHRSSSTAVYRSNEQRAAAAAVAGSTTRTTVQQSLYVGTVNQFATIETICLSLVPIGYWLLPAIDSTL